MADLWNIYQYNIMSAKGTSLNAVPSRTRKPSKKASLNPIGTSLNAKIEPSKRTKKKPPSRTKKVSLNVGSISLNDTESAYNETMRKISNFRRKTASRKIGSFMTKHRSKIRLLFLNTVCTDSNVCIAFGKETKLIREFFNNFDFRLMSRSPRVIGAPSDNGVIRLLTFEKDGYVANAIFKTSNHQISDNLAYEAIVGRFLNKQKLRFPCFLETYGLYYNSHVDKKITRFKKMDINKENLIRSCKYPLSVGIMIENIKDSYTLHYIISSYINSDTNYFNFMNNHLLYILYQIYAPLSMLSDVFTHYDLHGNNVMLYTVENNKYIRYHYHYPEKTVSFNSAYIVKIIDYGRCFFKDDLYNPYDIYLDLCGSDSCVACGKYSGFDWLGPDKHYSSQERNMSEDLKLLKFITEYKQTYHKDLLKLVNSVVYLYDDETPEFVGENDKRIFNVNDARRHLEKVMKKMFFKKNNDYDSVNKLGEMHIYSDGRPMEYISV